MNRYEVHLVKFGKTESNGIQYKTFNGNHYAILLTKEMDGTLLVVPGTSKKKGRKYRGGFTVDCYKYQDNPSVEKVFFCTRKITEVDRRQILTLSKGCIYKLDDKCIERCNLSLIKVLELSEM